MDMKDRNVFRSGSVIGIPVKTPDLKELGEIQEIVVDVSNGRVVYAVLCFQGFFGFGDKLFAVPWREFRLVHAEGDTYFIVDTTREKLKKLRGFNAEHWPSNANSHWDELLAEEDDFDEEENE